jgi:hypothetical protein
LHYSKEPLENVRADFARPIVALLVHTQLTKAK